jgi:nucleotide-binding universal stress UspA family protein
MEANNRRRLPVGTIVVGVDGSEGAQAALEFALEEARLRAAEVKAVSAWRIPTVLYNAGWVPVPLDPAEYEKLAKSALEASLEAAGAGASGLEVRAITREGHAADVLVDEARGAELLVVGSRGLGGFRGLLLGSVSQQCAQHAPCPVAIVPGAKEPAES